MNRMFRCWDDFQKKYVFEGFHVIGEVTCFGGMDHVLSETAKERREARGYTSSIEAWIDFTMEQYIGRRDIDGKYIYENDKVMCYYIDAMLYHGTIVYKEDTCSYVIQINDHEFHPIEKEHLFRVIGNSHEVV